MALSHLAIDAGAALERHALFGIPIAALTMEQVLDRVGDAIRDRRQLLIGVVNAAKVVNMRRDPELGSSVLSADLILADGVGVVWASRLLGHPLPERVAGIDLMLGMLERGARLGWRVYLLGASEEVVEKVVNRMADYPGLQVVGWRNGYFTPQEEPAVAAAVKDARPDILLVAMTSPKKERFLARWREWLEVPVCHGVGGSFDVLAGKVQRAPAAWQRLGLEWLYRVKQEPRRLWKRYLVTNTLFCAAVVVELLRGLRLRVSR